jgi:hypothetical protein
MGSDLLVLVPYGPCAVDVLSDEDLGSGVAASSFARRDVDDEASHGDAVIVGDGGLVCEADLEVAVALGDLDEG